MGIYTKMNLKNKKTQNLLLRKHCKKELVGSTVEYINCTSTTTVCYSMAHVPCVSNGWYLTLTVPCTS